MNDNNMVSVKVLDRIYKIKCPPEQTQELQEAAICLDEQMKKIRKNGGITSLEQIAIVAALNISHELTTLKKQKKSQVESMSQRIQDMHQRIQQFIHVEAI